MRTYDEAHHWLELADETDDDDLAKERFCQQRAQVLAILAVAEELHALVKLAEPIGMMVVNKNGS